MPEIKTDICVIGAGSGGLSVAAGAVQMGARVTLIEAGEMGGDCLNFGCIPSKSLIHAAKRGLGYASAMEHVHATINAIAPHDSQERFETLGCTVIRAFASFSSPKTVEAGEFTIKARRFVVATGSRPMVPPIAGLDDTPYLTNETIWELREKPAHLLIIGAGPIGMEMAQAHRRLGCDVTVVETAWALGREDPEAVAVVTAALRAEGVKIVENSKVAEVSGQAGNITLHLENGTAVSGSHLLVAAGRIANADSLGLEKAEVDRTRKGIKVDARMRTSNKRVFAIGDVTGGLQFTHVAGYQAGVILRSLLFGLPAKTSMDYIPRATYTDPELAQIGLTEEEARDKFPDKIEIARAEMSGNDRAIATARADRGFVKVLVHKGRPVGVTIVGPDAGELISFWALALANRLKMSQIAGMVAPYPTLAEINKRAAGAYYTPRLFDNPKVKLAVKLVQRLIP